MGGGGEGDGSVCGGRKSWSREGGRPECLYLNIEYLYVAMHVEYFLLIFLYMRYKLSFYLKFGLSTRDVNI